MYLYILDRRTRKKKKKEKSVSPYFDNLISKWDVVIIVNKGTIEANDKEKEKEEEEKNADLCRIFLSVTRTIIRDSFNHDTILHRSFSTRSRF